MGGKVWDSFFFFNISYYPYCWIGWETLGGKPWWKHVKIHTANDLLFFFLLWGVIFLKVRPIMPNPSLLLGLATLYIFFYL